MRVWHVLLAVLIVVVLAALGPFAVLWALNTLFHVDAEYTMVNALAVLLLIGALKVAATDRHKPG